MRKLATWRTIATAFTLVTVVHAIRTKQPSGRFLRVPYDFRFPTIGRIRERFWNPDDPRLFTPHVFGVGWSLNVYQLVERFRRYRGEGASADGPREPEN